MQTEVCELMKENPVTITADTTLKEAAQRMKAVDCGVLPVGEASNPVGIITDRDIVTRAIAEGVDPGQAKVRDYMTAEIVCCNDDDTLAQAAELMNKHNISRLLVKNNGGNVCGIITFGSMIRKDPSLREIGKVVESAVGEKAA